MARKLSREQEVLWLYRFYAEAAHLGTPEPLPTGFPGPAAEARKREIAEFQRLRAKALPPADALITGDWPFKKAAAYQQFAEKIRLADFCRAYVPQIVRRASSGVKWQPGPLTIRVVAAQLPSLARWGGEGRRPDSVGFTGMVTLSCDTDSRGTRRVTWTFADAFEILRAIAQLYARCADHIRPCVECHAVFFGVRRTRYCSPRCSARGRQRRWRQHRAS